jgi:hypothetical protein
MGNFVLRYLTGKGGKASRRMPDKKQGGLKAVPLRALKTLGTHPKIKTNQFFDVCGSAAHIKKSNFPEFSDGY